MLTTHADDGTLHGRPMSNNGDVEFDGDSWFFARGDSRKVVEIEAAPSCRARLHRHRERRLDQRRGQRHRRPRRRRTQAGAVARRDWTAGSRTAPTTPRSCSSRSPQATSMPGAARRTARSTCPEVDASRVRCGGSGYRCRRHAHHDRLRCRCPARRVPGAGPTRAGRPAGRLPRRTRRHPGPAAGHRRGHATTTPTTTPTPAARSHERSERRDRRTRRTRPSPTSSVRPARTRSSSATTCRP